MRYESLFFDLDDTLWDTYHNNKESLEEVYADYRLDRHYGSFEAFFRAYWPRNVRLWEQYRNHEIDKETLTAERFRPLLRPLGMDSPETVRRINEDFLKRCACKTGLVSGAVGLLERLRPVCRLYVLSNGFREVQYLKLRNSGLAPYFSKVILSEDAGFRKPQKGIFDYALAETRSRREATLMIGDSLESDIAGAACAGLDRLWFNPYGLRAEGIEPTYTVRRLDEIAAIVLRET